MAAAGNPVASGSCVAELKALVALHNRFSRFDSLKEGAVDGYGAGNGLIGSVGIGEMDDERGLLLVVFGYCFGFCPYDFG
jgi:hypothetical protein